jgi:hypothetical protein
MSISVRAHGYDGLQGSVAGAATSIRYFRSPPLRKTWVLIGLTGTMSKLSASLSAGLARDVSEASLLATR